jgi:hypothetical protein
MVDAPDGLPVGDVLRDATHRALPLHQTYQHSRRKDRAQCRTFNLTIIPVTNGAIAMINCTTLTLDPRNAAIQATLDILVADCVLFRDETR